MASVYEIVTGQIIKKLEQGVIPWRRPWNSSNQAVSWKTQKPYRGINVMMLEPGEYATFKQISEAGGKVKKGETGHIVVFWKWNELEDGESGKTEKAPILRYYKVFEINRQCEGMKSRRKDGETYEHDPIEEAQKIVEGYRNSPPVTFAPGRAFYAPSTDSISVPAISDYKVPQEYYSTLFHEMVHSTGHKRRLNREGVQGVAAFGSEIYSREELIAEIGAAMLCGVSGIVQETLDNSAAYVASWLRRLKDDSRLIVYAAAAAQKAADYIQGIAFSDGGEE